METVYNLVRDGVDSKQMIFVKSGLKFNQVEAALYNLCFAGMVEIDKKNPAGVRYALPDKKQKPAPALSRNTFLTQKNKKGRPKKLDKSSIVQFTPQSKQAREAFYRMGGSRWINRILAGLGEKN
jgi:nitrogen fixation protein FixH